MHKLKFIGKKQQKANEKIMSLSVVQKSTDTSRGFHYVGDEEDPRRDTVKTYPAGVTIGL